MNRWITQSLPILALLALSTGAMAAGGEVHHETFAEVGSKIGFHAFNLFILIALIVWLAGGKIKDALASRSTGIRVELESAAKAKADAKERFDALQARLELAGKPAEVGVQSEADGSTDGPHCFREPISKADHVLSSSGSGGRQP